MINTNCFILHMVLKTLSNFVVDMALRKVFTDHLVLINYISEFIIPQSNEIRWG